LNTIRTSTVLDRFQDSSKTGSGINFFAAFFATFFAAFFAAFFADIFAAFLAHFFEYAVQKSRYLEYAVQKSVARCFFGGRGEV